MLKPPKDRLSCVKSQIWKRILASDLPSTLSWNDTLDIKLIGELKERGFEIGCHGLRPMGNYSAPKWSLQGGRRNLMHTLKS